MSINRERLSKNDIVTIDQEDICQLAAMFQDYRDTSGTNAGLEVIQLLRHIRMAISITEAEQREALFWQTTFGEWNRWMQQSPNQRKDPKLLCTKFDNPERALEILINPPLSEAKCARLWNGLDEPTSEYEKYVSRARNSDRQKEIMFHEKTSWWRTMYRLRFITNCSERYIKGHLYAKHGHTLLDAIESKSCRSEAVSTYDKLQRRRSLSFQPS